MEQIEIPASCGTGRMMWRMAHIKDKPILIHAPEHLRKPRGLNSTNHRQEWIANALGWYRRMKKAGNA